jgi:hypothetical protein
MQESKQNSIQKYSKRSSASVELHWRILYFVPHLIISALFAYGTQYQAASDIMVLKVYLANRAEFPLTIYSFTLLFVVVQKFQLIFFGLKFVFSMMFASKQKQQLSSSEIDNTLIKVNHINLSAILYSRITKADPALMKAILARETAMAIFQIVIKITVLLDSSFQQKCSHNNYSLISSVLLTFLCLIRVLIYYNKRVESKSVGRSNENVMIAVDYIQSYVNDNQL